jgi:hypothetical protein
MYLPYTTRIQADLLRLLLLDLLHLLPPHRVGDGLLPLLHHQLLLRELARLCSQFQTLNPTLVQLDRAVSRP